MSSFSIMPNSQVDIVDQYTDFLSRELNNELWYVDENDIYNPFLLQQMGVLRASRIQKAVETNGAILYEGLRYTNDTIRTSSREIATQMGHVAAGITSSLDRGFTAMHHSLGCINEGIAETNTHLGNIHSSLGTLNENVGQTNQHLKYLTTATIRGLSALHQEQQETNQQLQDIGKSMYVASDQLQKINQALCVMGSMIGQGFSLLAERLNATNTLLKNVLDELCVPKTQRERRFHIEEGAKYLAMALKENDKFYYEDAIAEFETAIQIERKDFYSWFSLGFIYLRSVHHINIAKAVEAFERFVHYARAEAVQCNNQVLKLKIDEAYLLMAEAKYLLQNPYEAIQLTEKCESNKEKALFMKVKYLSFMGDDGSQQRAADILRDLLHQNPFLSLQVLEDIDIIKNQWVVSMLEQLRLETIDEAHKQYEVLLQEIKKLNASYDGLQEIVDMMNKHTYLDAVEALYRIKNAFPGELGLSVRWTTCNVGAKSPEENGDYYTFDKAMAKFKGKLPTKEQWEELIDKCTWEWIALNGVNGYKVIGPNGNSIFLPAAGGRYGRGQMYNEGVLGYYWSSTEYNPFWAYYLVSYSSIVYMSYDDHYDGRSVRLVQ